MTNLEEWTQWYKNFCKEFNGDLKEDFSKLKKGDIVSFDEVAFDTTTHYEKKKIYDIGEISVSIMFEENLPYIVFKKDIINLKIEKEGE